MSDPWEILASSQPAPAEDNGEWGQSDEWARAKNQACHSSPQTWSIRGSPNRNYNRSGDRSLSSSPRFKSRQYSGRERSPWRPDREREASRTFRGREASRSFRGERVREASRMSDWSGPRNAREVSRSSRRPDFSVSPSPGFRSRNWVERRSPGLDSRSISPDNHFRRNRDRGRSPSSKDKSKEILNGPGASWSRPSGLNEKVPDGWGQDSSNVDQTESGSLSPWSKAAKDMERNYNNKAIDGWGEKLSQSGADNRKQNNKSNFSPDRNSTRRRSELGEGDLRLLLDSGQMERTGEDRERWRGRERDRRERRSPSESQRRGRYRERRGGFDERLSDNGQNSMSASWEGPKWRDWSINALHNSIKDISWTDFKWEDKNTIINEGAAENITTGGTTGGAATGDDMGPPVENTTGPPAVNPEPGAVGVSNENAMQDPPSSSPKPKDEDGNFLKRPSENEDLQSDPDYPPLLYDPWDMDSEMPVVNQAHLGGNNSSLDRKISDPSSFNAHNSSQSVNHELKCKLRSPTGYESSVENSIKPPGFEKLEDNSPSQLNVVNPSSMVLDAPPSQLNDLNPKSRVYEKEPKCPPLLDDPWGSILCSNAEENNPNDSLGRGSQTNGLTWGSKTSEPSTINAPNPGNNVPNSSNWGNDAPKQSNWGSNVSNSSNWGTNAANSSNWGSNAPNSSNRGINAPISLNRAHNAPNSSNWGCNASSSSNWGSNNAPNSSNWGTASSSKLPNRKTNIKVKSQIRPPGFENLMDNPSRPPGFENLAHNTKSTVFNARSVSINGNSGDAKKESVSIFKRGITDFAEEKMEPFFTRELINGKLFANLINKFVAKVISAVGPGAPKTEADVNNFLRDQAAKLTHLAHEYLSMHVNRKVVQEVIRSTK